jgi:hypothetical protein
MPQRKTNQKTVGVPKMRDVDKVKLDGKQTAKCE